jgi:hypothetical protein
MKQYSLPTILFAFLSTTIVVSCHKEKEPLSTSGSANYVYSTPPPAKIIYSDLSLVSGTDHVFNFLNSSTYPISCNGTYCTVRSRYILHNDSSFVLQYNYDLENEYRRGIQYKGWYAKIDNSYSLTWEGWSAGGPWGATAILRGDTMIVKYNWGMMLSDFEDAMYLRKR